MKKIILMLGAALLFASLLQGCKGSPDETTDGIMTNDINYEQISDENLSEDMLALIDRIKANRGYYILKEEDGLSYVFIGSGEKNTGGYSITMVSAQDIEGKTRIVVSETAPCKDDIVTEALTYPYIVIGLNKDLFIDAEIINTEDEVFEEITEERLRSFDIIGGITSIEKSADRVTVLVEGPITERTAYDKARVTVDDKTEIYIAGEKVDMDKLENGMRVGIIFEGPVAESYPVQAYASHIYEVADE